ncbi:MAG: RNA polymerase sigma factor [Thermoguttaceae bacterium]
MHDKQGTISSTLLESVKAQRAEAWRRLVDLYGQVVYCWRRKSGLKAEDACDTVQEVFAAVAKKVADFRRSSPNDSFTAWISVITRNKIHDYFRRCKGQVQAAGGTKAQEFLQRISQPTPPTMTEDWPSKSDLKDAEKIIFSRAIELVRAEFEARTWQACWKTAVEGRSAADVAADMDMSLHAVYKAKSRVLLRLREELAGLFDENAN